VDQLLGTKKRKLAEIEELKERVDAVRKKVLGQVSSNCLQQIKALRPPLPTSDYDQEEKATAAQQQQQQAAAAMRESAILTQVPPLQERAKGCVEVMGVRSEALTARIESLRTTATAVSNFLKGTPSKVEKAIRQSQRGGAGGGVEELQEKEEGGVVERATRSKKGVASPAAGAGAGAAAAKIPTPPAATVSALSMLSAHLGQG